MTLVTKTPHENTNNKRQAHGCGEANFCSKLKYTLTKTQYQNTVNKNQDIMNSPLKQQWDQMLTSNPF
jgi:hypothetical protein